MLGGGRTRAEEAAEQQVVTTYKRISELEERVKRRAKQHDRLASLGYDRCWNRYWVLGSLVPGSCGEQQPVLSLTHAYKPLRLFLLPCIHCPGCSM